MDVASERARRKNRSSTNINHLSLAPLTSKLPLKDLDALPDSSHSYIEGRSAPTTPRFLGHTSATPRSRSHARTPSVGDSISKSKSSSALSKKKPRSGASTPRRRKDDSQLPHHGGDSDWILRTGAMVSTEAREFKGQAWLVSRQSSTSLSGMRADPGQDAYEQELVREREMSRRGSSAFADDDASPVVSRLPSRFQSRRPSAVESRSQVMTPADRNGDSYFPEPISGPDFVNLDEKLEQLEKDSEQDDEAAIRQLVREGQTGKRSWLGNMMGLSLFAVDENDEDSDSDADSLDDELQQSVQGARTPRQVEGITMLPVEKIPAPAKEGGWNDATWLLSVATKVLF